MRTSNIVLATALVALAMATATAACSDSERPAASTGGSSSSTSSSSGSSVVPVVDAGASAADAAPELDLCTPPTDKSLVVGEQEIPGDPPVATGGTLKPGLYVLNELQAYTFAPDAGAGTDPPAPGPTGTFGQATMVVTPQSIRFMSSTGMDPAALPADTHRVVKYQVVGTSLHLTEACTASATASELSFSVTDNQVALFTTPRHIQVFLLKP